VIVVYVKHLAVQTDSDRDGSDDWCTRHTVFEERSAASKRCTELMISSGTVMGQTD
jgi:hypothetical protein